MTIAQFTALALSKLPYAPNEQQRLVLGALARFCSPAARAGKPDANRAFVLNGYAGTGKTSLMSALVQALRLANVPVVLMAPTGRAAKVLSSFAGMPAHTIHRKIFRHSLGGERPALQDNNTVGTMFIVDEASMIPGGDTADNLLADLVQYVYAGTQCSMILVGDTAQLPPVGSEFSPAMDIDTLRGLGLSVSRATLTAIARQAQLSGILANATALRHAMRMEPMPMPKIYTKGFPDVRITTPMDLAEQISAAYGSDDVAETMLITRSNRRAADFNRAIRGEVLYYEDDLAAGDMLMVAKNNYFRGNRTRGIDFIANGDILIVNRVHGCEVRYGMRFADVSLSLSDKPDVAFDAKIIMDTLDGEEPALSGMQMRRLAEAIVAEAGVAGVDVPFAARLAALRTNPYWNALQVKYAYAVTCHKAQGGQWKHVFVDMCHISPDAIGLDFYRWLYTAVTRARSTLTVIKADDELSGGA